MLKQTLLLFISLVLSCKALGYSDSIYIGEYFDENYRYTLPVILEFNNVDSVRITKILNDQFDKETYEVSQDSIFGKKKYSYSFDDKETLLLKTGGQLFHFKKSSPIRQSKLHLSGSAFKLTKKNQGNDLSVVEKWQFKSDSLVICREYYYLDQLCYVEVETENYNILNYDNKYQFLILQGKRTPEVIWNIRLGEGENIVFTNCNTGESFLGKNSAFTTKKGKVFHVTEKQHIYQYYQFEIKPLPIDGFNELKKSIVQNCSSKFIDGPEGYIILRFVLNAQGEPGRFVLEQMNQEYESTSYDHSIVDKVMDETLKHKWNPASRDGHSYDCYYFLVFKIHKNRLVDVYI